LVYDQVRVEPNDISFKHAIQLFQNTKDYDAVVAVGGGSVIDTAKAANLYATYPPNDFYDYVNPPLGKGLPMPAGNDLPPLIAIPTILQVREVKRQVSPFLMILPPNPKRALPIVDSNQPWALSIPTIRPLFL
jgi:hypothetical protein